MKKVLSLLLSLIMFCSITAGLNLTANDDDEDSIYNDFECIYFGDNGIEICWFKIIC